MKWFSEKSCFQLSLKIKLSFYLILITFDVRTFPINHNNSLINELSTFSDKKFEHNIYVMFQFFLELTRNYF